MEMEASASSSSPVIPMAINASTRVEPAVPCRSPFSVDVVLQTIARDVSGEGTVAIDRAGAPVHGYRHHFHVVAVGGGERDRADRQGAAVGDVRRAIGGRGIVGGRERGRDK